MKQPITHLGINSIRAHMLPNADCPTPNEKPPSPPRSYLPASPTSPLPVTRPLTLEANKSLSYSWRAPLPIALTMQTPNKPLIAGLLPEGLPRSCVGTLGVRCSQNYEVVLVLDWAAVCEAGDAVVNVLPAIFQHCRHSRVWVDLQEGVGNARASRPPDIFPPEECAIL